MYNVQQTDEGGGWAIEWEWVSEGRPREKRRKKQSWFLIHISHCTCALNN
jgi:hypothetical protein